MTSVSIGTTIEMGTDSLSRLDEFNNERVFIVTDNFISNSELMPLVTTHFNDSNVLKVFDEVVPDPPISNIVDGLEIAAEFKPTIFIAFGGGSAIDAAKGIFYFGKQTNIIGKVPFIAIPTTSGTGSEVTNFSIITDDDAGVKYPLITDEILPDIAILNTQLVMGLPPGQTANTGIDVLTHAIEAYVSTNANEISDALAEKAIKYVFKYLPRAYRDGDDEEAREKMHIASTIAGLAFNQASLGLNHGIAHAAGAKLHIPHGMLNGILLNYVIRYNSGLANGKNTRAAERYRQIADMLNLNSVSPTIGTRSLVNNIQKLLKSLDLPTSFSEYGVEKTVFNESINNIAENAVKDQTTQTNPVSPTVQDVIEILNEAY